MLFSNPAFLTAAALRVAAVMTLTTTDFCEFVLLIDTLDLALEEAVGSVKELRFVVWVVRFLAVGDRLGGEFSMFLLGNVSNKLYLFNVK